MKLQLSPNKLQRALCLCIKRGLFIVTSNLKISQQLSINKRNVFKELKLLISVWLSTKNHCQTWIKLINSQGLSISCLQKCTSSNNTTSLSMFLALELFCILCFQANCLSAHRFLQPSNRKQLSVKQSCKATIGLKYRLR